MFMQYVGSTDYFKVFVLVHNQFYKDNDSFSMFDKGDIIINPIKENEYDTWIKRSAQSQRYEVRQYGEIFVGDEGHRDSYPFHIPGFKFIKDLTIGMIIPISGLKTEEFLSSDDIFIINKIKTLNSFMSENRKKNS